MSNGYDPADERTDEMNRAFRRFVNGEISEEEFREYEDVEGFGRRYPVAVTKRQSAMSDEEMADNLLSEVDTEKIIEEIDSEE